MYKRFSLSDLVSIQNNFIPHLYEIIKHERCQWINDFMKICFKEGDSLYFFKRSEVSFRISKKEDLLVFSDEIDKIELILHWDQKSGLQNLIKNYIVKKERQLGQKTIENILMDEFKAGNHSNILGKPYLVYDIETTVVDDIKQAKFLLAYSMEVDETGKMQYACILEEDLKGFVDKMLAFDGYIVGYNQIWFDNPVSVWNAGYGQEEIDILNKKSIDLFVFIRKLTKKMIGLNRVSEALVGVSKTLDSGAEGEVLWKQYQETWDVKFLEQFKKYCKNDVRMTALVMLYFLHFQKLFIDGEEYVYTLEEFVEKANNLSGESNDTEKVMQDQSIF